MGALGAAENLIGGGGGGDRWNGERERERVKLHGHAYTDSLTCMLLVRLWRRVKDSGDTSTCAKNFITATETLSMYQSQSHC